MTPVAVVFLALSIVVVWGGMVVSALALRRHPELDEYPPGATDDHRADAGIIEHDT